MNIDRFEELLKTHPNWPFVNSVIKGLQQDFWPFAEPGDVNELPHIQPNHLSASIDPKVLRKAQDRELEMGRFSEPFDTLLLGMKTAPLGLVPKKASDKWRMITDHSAGPSSLNTSIPQAEARVKYNTVQDLTRSLLAYQRLPNWKERILFLWKCDIQEVFRLLPVHPLWQVCQVILIDGKYYVDWRLVFGSSALPQIWCGFASLVAWITIHIYGIDVL